MARFFIDRPVFAWVIAIGIMLGGLLCLRGMPIAQYPDIAPPAIQISVSYAGASAETVQNTVIQIIEQEMTGLDGLLYFKSTSNSDGSATITLTFAQGTDADVAQVQVQNKLSLAQSRLPTVVQQQGIRVAKAASNFLMVVSFVSRDGSMSSTDISDFIASTVQDRISRTPGVGNLQLFGASYAMRIWVDPDKLHAFQLVPSDISTAIRAQNAQVTFGELGALPSVPGQRLTATVVGPAYLNTPEQFGAIILRVKPDGSQVRLSDVARVELDAQSYAISSQFNGRPTSGIGIQLAAGANAVQTADAVRQALEELKPSLPNGLETFYAFDTTPFVQISIKAVITALIEAMVLVFIVMLVFLQNWRATVIPTLAIPVVLLGTIAVLSFAGYSINTLTMFAMVLAIGLLVDDAIVVVENVERLMETEGLSPLEATRKSMDQISGALVGIALVVAAVFLPMFFFVGSAGVIYRQFSLTIVTAMVLSVLVALVFTPALCATMLKPRRPVEGKQRGFSGWFNRGFARTNRGYVRGVRGMIGRPASFMLVYLVVAGAMGVLYLRLPSSFLPNEDQGVMMVQVVGAPGATIERTEQATRAVTKYLLEDEGARVESVMMITGFSYGGRGQASAMAFVRLKDWSARTSEADSVGAISARLMGHFSRYRDAQIVAIAPPPVSGLGNATGFTLQLVDRAGLGHEALTQAQQTLMRAASGSSIVTGVRANTLAAEPRFRVTIDWERAIALGVQVNDVNETFSSALGSAYVGDFLDRGRVKRVFLQADAASRMQPGDLEKWHVRNASGQMVPFSAFATTAWETGSPQLSRYNGTDAIELQGDAAPGQSTGAALAEMERLAAELPAGIGIEWTGLSYEERAAGGQAFALYAVSLLVVFLCLAALYESWAIPVAVLLVVPMGILGVVLATMGRGLANDVYFQVGVLTIIGLSAKNAILIVEFAKEHFEAGEDAVKAVLHAAEERLRPILMTSLAFGLGVVPLALATGAGAGGRIAIGTGIVGGVLTGTLLAVFFVPLFFVVVLRLMRVRRASERAEAPAQPPAEKEA